MLLDWSKITWQDFQNLINELAWAEFGKAGYVPSDPFIGADGGLDGVYRGKYGGLEGLWGIQATIDKDFSTKLNNSLNSAKTAGVDFLIYATSAKSMPALEKDNLSITSNNDRVKKIIFWDKDTLEKLISYHPWIGYKYFNIPQVPMFVPIQVYRKFLNDPLRKILGREEELDNIMDKFIQAEDQNNKIAVVHAPGGYGKTHFISSIAQKIYNDDDAYEVLFCNPVVKKVNDAFNEELKGGQKYLLVLDDAERYPDVSKELIANVLANTNIKLILSCRTSGIKIIENELYNSQHYKYFNLRLPKLDRQILIDILNINLRKSIEHPGRLVDSLQGNLYLIMMVAQLKNRDESVDPFEIKKKIAHDLVINVTNSLREFGLKEFEIKQFCTQLSLIVPFSKENDLVINKLLELLPFFQNKNRIIQVLRILVDSNIMHEIGSRLRFNPDMIGDICLSEKIAEPHGNDLISEAFTSWLNICPSEITGNIAAASRHLDDVNAVENSIGQFIQPFINNYSQDNGMNRCENLKLITNVAHLAPTKALELIELYETNPINDPYSPGRDDYGQIVFHILHLEEYTEKVLRLICLIDQKGTKGTYNNYLPNTLIKNLASPIEVGMEIATNTLIILLNWISEKDCPLLVAKLAAEAAKESLAGAHDHHESHGITLTFGKRMLRLHKKVLEYRDLGVKILQKLLNSENDDFVRVGLSIIPDIGDDGDPNGDLWARIIEDKQEAIKMLEELLTTRKSLPWSIKVIIEDLLIKIWANNDVYPTLEKEIERVMQFIGKDTEYKVYAYYAAPDFHINDFEEVKKGAPTQGRWAWLVREFFRYDEVKEEEIRSKVEDLSQKYNSLDDAVNFLKLLDHELNYQQRWGYAPIVEVWSKVNPLLPKSVAENPEILKQIPKRFHTGLHIACANQNVSYINVFYRRFIEEKEEIDPDVVNTLLVLIGNFSVEPSVVSGWIKYIVNKTENLYILNNTLHRLFFYFNKPENVDKRSPLIGILMLYLEKGLKPESFDAYDFILHHAREWKVSGLEKLKDKLFQILKDAPRIDHHGDELVNFTITTLDEFIEFVEYRLDKQSEPSQNWETFDAIPSQGFGVSKNLISGYEEFKKFIDKMIEWYKEDKIYTFDIENLIAEINRQESSFFLRMYISEQLDSGESADLERAITSLHMLSFWQDNLSSFASVLEASLKSGCKDDAFSALSHQIHSGSFSSTVGEAPPALVNKKELLLKLKDLVNDASLKDFINNLIKDMENQIRQHIEDGEEMKNPKY